MEPRRSSEPRRVYRLDWRWLVLVLWVGLHWIQLPASWSRALGHVSPLVALVSTIARRTVSVTVGVAFFLGVLMMVHARPICRWCCPLGPVVDFLSRVCGRSGGPKWPVGSWLLAFGLGLSIVSVTWVAAVDPFVLAGAAARVIRRPSWDTAGVWLLVAIPLLVSLLWPRDWCRSWCPLGALQDALKALRRETTPGGSVGHGGWSRRHWLQGLAAASLGAVTGGHQVRFARAGVRPIRPPGALSEERFCAMCWRCGACVQACPTRIIVPDTGEHGPSSWLTPRVVFNRGHCLPQCVRCTQVCPSGALQSLRTAEAKQMHSIGVAEVAVSVCWLTEGRECGRCVAVCPYDAIRVQTDGFDSRVVVRREQCTGCGACEQECPTRPTRAITVRPLTS